jgi:hypothetical protein
LLGDAERVVDLDTKVTDGAFELCVPKQELNRPQIAGLLVNLRGLGSAASSEKMFRNERIRLSDFYSDQDYHATQVKIIRHL